MKNLTIRIILHFFEKDLVLRADVESELMASSKIVYDMNRALVRLKNEAEYWERKFKKLQRFMEEMK